MLTVPGYQISTLVYQSVHTEIYRGTRESDGLPVIIKTTGQEQPASSRLARLRHEYQILKGLELPGVVRCYALLDDSYRVVLVLSDSGGVALRELLGGRAIDVDRFLELAIKLTETLSAVHEAGIIHKDINPSKVADCRLHRKRGCAGGLRTSCELV